MHNPKNKNCQKSTCDEHHSALRNPIFGGTHECDCTCPEQKEEWEEEFMPVAEKLENVCTDYAPVEATWDFIRTQIALAEQRGRDAQQKEDYEVAKAQQEKAFKSGAEMGEERGRREAKSQFDAMLAEDIEKMSKLFESSNSQTTVDGRIGFREGIAKATSILEARRLFIKK